MRTSLLTFALLLLTTGASMAGVLRVGSWSSSGSEPHSSLTAALAAAQAGDEVWVVSNTYREAEFIVPAGVSVYGGFIGSESSLSERNYASNVTILDGSGAHRVATVSGLLDGFTLRNGRTGDNGGGVIVKSGGVLSHCIAFANEAGYDGGGVFAEEGASVTNTLLTGNRAGNDGAALGGVPGYHAVNLTAADNLLTGMPVLDALTGVPASLQAGGVLDVAPPAISSDGGSTVLMKGWELDGNAISMPYTVTYADNGKKLRYWAANAVGVGVSNEVALTVTWTVTSSAQLLTPKAVCAGTTLADAGVGDPVFSPAPDGGATYTYSIDGTPISGLDYQLQYSDNGKLLTCEVKNADGSITGATTPAVRLAVMKAPDVFLTNIGNLSIEEGQPLCLPTPVVISNGSDVTAQGWKWRIGTGAENTFNSCDKATTAMKGATVYYTAENGCSTTPTETIYTTLTVTNPVGEFLQTVSALCAGMTLNDCISFAEGGNTGDYYIGNTYIGTPGAEGNFTTSWADVQATALTVAHNLQVLRFSYNGGKSERRMTLTVHAVPEITTDPATPGNALCLGDAHTLTIAATGDNLSYQWERSTNSTDGSDGDWNNVPGSTTAACRLTADATAYYRCAVTGVCIDRSAGVTGGKITSAAAQLTVNDRPVIPDVTTSAPLTLCEGETVTALLAPLTPTLSGTPATSEGWTLGGINIADDYTVVATDNGKVFGYRASNACGERTATFSTLKLGVDSKPQVTQDPLDVTAVEDTPVRLSVSASGSNLTYRWQKKLNGEGDDKWADIDAAAEPSAATPVYSFTAANITTAVGLDGADVLTDYRCVVGTTNACATTTVNSAPATVTVTRSKSAVSIRRQPAAYEVCNSAAAPYAPGFTVEVEGSGRFVYKWYGINDKINPVAQTPASGNLADAVADKTNTFQPTAAGTYFCVVTSTDDHAGAQTQTVMLTVSEAPVINGITPASATICEGGSVTLGVDAVGSALTYQWYEQAGATPDPTVDTPKGTAPTFTPVGLSTTATFYCVVGSGSVCTARETSNSVVVTVQQAPKITTQPVSQAVCGATGVSLSVVAANADTYQWYYNGATTGTDSPTLANVTAGGVYTCVVSQTGGVCGEATSVPALITVADQPTVNLGSRDNLTACAGDLVTLPSPEVETGGSVIVPEKTGWYVSTEPNPATATLVASFLAGNAAVTYHYKLTYQCSAGGTETVLTTAAGMPELTVSVTPAPTVSGTLKDVTKNAGESVTEADVVDGLTLTGGTKQWLLAGTPVTLPYTTTSADNGKLFSCEVTNACGAKATLSAVTGKLTVNSLVITTQPVSQTYCEGVTGKKLSVVTNIPAGVTHQWYKDGVKITANGGDKEYILGSATTDAGVYTCEVKLGSLTVVSSSAVVTVNAKPKVVAATESVSVCAGSPLTLQCEATGTGLAYAWKKDGGAVLGTSSSLTLASAAAGQYVCTVSGTCTPAVTKTVTVAVSTPVKITRQPAGYTACSHSAITIAATGDGLGYQWYKADGAAVGAANSTSYTPAADGSYYCIVSGSCGSITSGTAVVSTLKNVAATISATTASLCPGESALLSAGVTAGEATAYQWANGATTIAGATKPTLTVNAAGTYKCTVTGVCGTSAPTVVITMNAVPGTFSLTQTGTLSGCERDEVTLENIPDAGYWTLGGQPIGKPDNNKYKLNAADDGKVLRYVKTNACGERVSSNSRPVSVSREPRLTSVFTTPYILQQGSKLNLTAPTNIGTLDAGYPKWTLDGKNGTVVSMGTYAPALTDDGKLLTYSVQGCGFLDETSTTLRVWNAPGIGGTSSSTNPVYGMEGKLFGLPAQPAVTPNNCTITAQGWTYARNDNEEKTTHGATNSLPSLGAASFNTHNGQYLYYQVGYRIPGNTTTYYVRRMLGKLVPWKEPTIGSTSVENWDYVCDNKTFAQMSRTFVTVGITNAYNCTFAAVTWETEDGRVVTKDSKPALTDDNKKLYCVQTWTSPDGTAKGKVRAPIATMRVTNVPTLTVKEGEPGTDNIIYVGQDVWRHYETTARDALNKATRSHNLGTNTFQGYHNQQVITISAVNDCGRVDERRRIDLSPRDWSYYKEGRVYDLGSGYFVRRYGQALYQVRKKFTTRDWFCWKADARKVAELEAIALGQYVWYDNDGNTYNGYDPYGNNVWRDKASGEHLCVEFLWD